MGNCFKTQYIDDEDPPCPPRIVYTRSRLTKLTWGKVHRPTDKSIWTGELLDLVHNYKEHVVSEECNCKIYKEENTIGGTFSLDESTNTVDMFWPA